MRNAANLFLLTRILGDTSQSPNLLSSCPQCKYITRLYRQPSWKPLFLEAPLYKRRRVLPFVKIASLTGFNKDFVHSLIQAENSSGSGPDVILFIVFVRRRTICNTHLTHKNPFLFTASLHMLQYHKNIS